MKNYLNDRSALFKIALRVFAAMLPLLTVLVINNSLGAFDALVLLKSITLIVPLSYIARMGLDVIVVKKYEVFGFTGLQLTLDMFQSLIIVSAVSALITGILGYFNILHTDGLINFAFFIFCVSYTMVQIQAAIIFSRGLYFWGLMLATVVPNLIFLVYWAAYSFDVLLSAIEIMLVPAVFSACSCLVGFFVLMGQASINQSNRSVALTCSWLRLLADPWRALLILIPIASHFYYVAPAIYIDESLEREIALVNSLRLAMVLGILNSFVSMTHYNDVVTASGGYDRELNFIKNSYTNIRNSVFWLNLAIGLLLILLVTYDIPNKLGFPVVSAALFSVIVFSHLIFNLYPLRDLFLQFIWLPKEYLQVLLAAWIVVVIVGSLVERDVFFVVVSMCGVSICSSVYVFKRFQYSRVKAEENGINIGR